MHCKPNDLAIVIGSETEVGLDNIGMIVRCVGIKKMGSAEAWAVVATGESDLVQIWVGKNRRATIRYGKLTYIKDAHLRPVSGLIEINCAEQLKGEQA